MISKSSEGGGSLPIVDYIGFMPIDLGAVNFDALPLPDFSSEVRVPLCLPPVQARSRLWWSLTKYLDEATRSRPSASFLNAGDSRVCRGPLISFAIAG